MALITVKDLKTLFHLHYIVNILLALSFLFLKNVKPLCLFLFRSCQLDYHETEILFFAAVIIVFRTRKQGAVNFIPYLSSACMFTKIANVLLYFYSEPVYGVIYVTCCILHLLLLPEPTYDGPENVVYFKGSDLEEELEKDKRITWFIELYAPWSPPCIQFSSCFSELSAKYHLENLRFAKVDLARNPQIAQKFKINTHPMSKQIPTLILFKNGVEYQRRPLVGNDRKLIPFALNFDNVVAQFDLNNVYDECKKNLKSIKSKRPKEE